MDLKVGDKVRIKDGFTIWGSPDYIEAYNQYKGKTTTVKGSTPNLCVLDIDGMRNSWSKALLEKVEDNNTQELLHNIKLNKGDQVQITDGKYKDIQGELLEYVELMDMYLIQTDEYNRLFIPTESVTLVSKECFHTFYDEVVGIERDIKVKIDSNGVTIIFPNDKTITSSIKEKIPMEEQIESLFYFGMSKQYTDIVQNN